MNQRYFERMQTVVFPIILSPATFSLGLCFPISRMRCTEWTVDSKIFTQGFLYHPFCHGSHILKDSVYQTNDISQGVCDSFPYYTFISTVCSQRQGFLASPLNAHSPPQCQPQSRWSTNIGQRTESNCSSWKAFDICSEDTKLINAIQRQKFDILVSLRGFVIGQCSVMKILKIDWTEYMEPPPPAIYS